MRNALRFLAPLVAALVVTAACNAPRAGSSPTPSATGTPNFTGKTLNIVTGGAGPVYILYGARLAPPPNKKTSTPPGAPATTAAVDKTKPLRGGQAHLAGSPPDTPVRAATGTGTAP